MARTLSLHRCRAGLIDLVLPVRSGIAAYQFQAASNFDASFSTFETVPSGGKASKTAVDLGIDGSSKFRGLTRFLFVPADYGLDDTKPMFIRVSPIPVYGAGASPTPGTAEPMLMVPPYSSAPNRPIVLKGTAPAGSDMSSSIEIQLPGQCQNPRIQNNGSADLFVAFEAGGPEFRVPVLSNEFTNFEMVYPSVSSLFVRGDGSATTFNAVLSLRNNRV